jgi:hypothetical protein
MSDSNEDDINSLGMMMRGRPMIPARPKRKAAPDFLEAGAATYRERNKLYGDNYHHFGKLMMGLFPQGLRVETHDDWNRLALVINCAGKLQRYTQSFTRGGHQDSAHDLMVYAAMLEELTKEEK